MADKTGINPQLERLAKKIAEEALGDISLATGVLPVSFADRLDAFKALTAYHVSTIKTAPKLPEKEDGEGTFGNFKKRMKRTQQEEGTA